MPFSNEKMLKGSWTYKQNMGLPNTNDLGIERINKTRTDYKDSQAKYGEIFNTEAKKKVFLVRSDQQY